MIMLSMFPLILLPIIGNNKISLKFKKWIHQCLYKMQAIQVYVTIGISIQLHIIRTVTIRTMYIYRYHIVNVCIYI